MEIHYYDHLTSTNDVAKCAALEGAAALYTVCAKIQSGGVGRMGRYFASPRGGTYFSVVLRPRFDLSRFGAITPFCACAVHRALKELTGVSTDIKWINDLYRNGKKVCGILATSGVDKKGNAFVILGIGINTGSENLPPELDDIATTLPYGDIPRLVERILHHLRDLEVEINTGSWLSYYRENASCLGRDVTVIRGEEKTVARALDIDAEGGLIVLHRDGRKEILRGGEISLRLC
ncbi:MAG: biotin--[Clostridia bacterium]|nr:biotin--[acetyl-CoA-carboxylase] ligase [Clostridia bacterium]